KALTASSTTSRRSRRARSNGSETRYSKVRGQWLQISTQRLLPATLAETWLSPVFGRCLIQRVHFHERIAGGVIYSTQDSRVIARNEGNIDCRFTGIRGRITGSLNLLRLTVCPIIVSHHS